MNDKEAKFTAKLLAHLERSAQERGPDSMAAVMLANARAKLANADHKWDAKLHPSDTL
jgi:hypothetical protein